MSSHTLVQLPTVALDGWPFAWERAASNGERLRVVARANGSFIRVRHASVVECTHTVQPTVLPKHGAAGRFRSAQPTDPALSVWVVYEGVVRGG